jgi:BirA family biotin operon repressor/biotin-[acetyl-CoA-carboxylase] ligase
VLRSDAELILHLEEVGSTSDWLRQNAAQFADGQWVRADKQTAGRGRLGRSWEMPAGNLAASCLLRLRPADGPAAELGFVAALALHDAVAALVDPARLQLKWPNDLLLDGAKLSGILLEREGELVILGVGVNLAAAPVLPDRATIALADAGAMVAPGPFLEALAARFEARRAAWRAAGLAPLRLDWLARAHPPGTALRVENGGQRLAGRFRDLAADGALLLDGDDGLVHRIHAGDVWQGAPAPPAAGEG